MNATKALFITILLGLGCVALHISLTNSFPEKQENNLISSVIDSIPKKTYIADTCSIKDTFNSLKELIHETKDTTLVVDNLYKVDENFYFLNKNRNLLIEVDPEVIQEYYSD